MQIFYNVKAHLLSSAYSRIASVTRVIRFSKLKKKKKKKRKSLFFFFFFFNLQKAFKRASNLGPHFTKTKEKKRKKRKRMTA